MIKKFNTYIKESINAEDLVGSTAILKNQKNALYRPKEIWSSKSTKQIPTNGFDIEDTKIKIGDKKTITKCVYYQDKILIQFEYVSDALCYDLDNFTIIPNKRIYTKEDPYGEEDWNIE